MKIIIFFTNFAVFIFLLSCSAGKKIKENRRLLKEYAYCRCFEYASKDTAFFNKDISVAVYADISNYPVDVFNIIDTLAKKAASEIKPSEIPDHEGKKSVLLNCFLFYNSKKLDSLIKRMDKKIMEGW
ncbi:MAG: hypothetical protein WDN26_08440 [Chitinophagaceae bacterium]